MTLKVLLNVFYLVGVFSFCHSQLVNESNGISISLRDREIPNHGLVTTQDIGVDPNGTALAVGLCCNTTSNMCCSDLTTLASNVSQRDGKYPSGSGSWLYAHNAGFPYISPQKHRPDFTYGVKRNGRAVYVFRNRDGTGLSGVDGIWRCVIHDSSGIEQTKYIGVYSSETNNGTLSSVPGTLNIIQFSSMGEDPVVFNLTFNTTGGPATYVTWTIDGNNVSNLEDSRYEPSQIVVPNEQLYTAGDYSNVLTVSGRLPGEYGVSVTNDRTSQPVTPTTDITIIDYRQHVINNTSAMQSNTDGVITIAWALTNSTLVSRHFDRYKIQYRRCANQQNGCDDSQSLTITDTTISHYSLTDAIPLSTYEFNITLVKKSNHYFFPGVSGLSATVTVNITTGVLPPEITSVTELANFTSVLVTWNQPAGGLAVHEYIVSYRRLNGTNDICTSFQDEDNVTINSDRERMANTAILYLQTSSVYVVSVIGRNGSLYSNPDTLQFMTNSTIPSGAPQNLTIINSTSTSATISWNSVKCVHRNGLITHYTITYSPMDSTDQMTDRVNITDSDNGGSYTAGGLQPFTNYVFRVAAVNDAGVGVFATILTNVFTTVFTTVSTDNTINPCGDPRTTTDNNGTDTTNSSGKPSTNNPAVAAAVSVVILLIVMASVTLFVVIGIVYFRKIWYHTRTVSRSKVSSKLPELTSWNKDDPNVTHEMVQDKLSDAFESERTKTQIPSKRSAVGQGPTIEEFPKETYVIEGKEVSFKVVVSGYPQPTIQWYHNKDEVVEDYSTELEQNGSLHIPCSEKRHSGMYKLVARNSSGSAEKQVELKVLDEHQAPSPKDVDVSPVPVMEFGSFVANNHKNSNVGFKAMYQALDKGDNHTTDVGLSPENKKLNRFVNMTVYDDNHIVLKPTDTFKGERFINACYIDGYSASKRFVATQGPLPHTLTDFWRLVVQEKVPTIVMVTNLKEGKKEKCHQYWPDTGSVDYGPLNVTITDQQIFADYTVRSFQVRVANSSEQPLKVIQYHYTSWPDHGVPTYATSILAFHRRIKSQHKPRKGPMLVHCSAGVGRTGTFIAIDSVQEQVKTEKVVDIAGVVNKMRQQRIKMVQTQDQFMFIHDALLEIVTCGDTQISAADLRATLKKMETENPNTHKTAFQEQFEVLEQVTRNANESYQCMTALRHPDKNRRIDHLPSENHRVILKAEFPDYVNATFVDGYKHKKAYIIAEGPMDSTVRNFWKMIYDRKCGVIVMCSDFVENGEESSCHYWLSNGKGNFGEFNVVLLDQEECPGYTVQKLNLEMKKKPPQQVTQFHITNWNAEGRCTNMKSITDVIENVTIVQRRTGNNPIVVHCHDTVGRSGMFCAIMSTIECCKAEGVVDVFQVIKALRTQKPGAVLNVEQYHLVFNAVLTYLDSFDTYANFQSV